MNCEETKHLLYNRALGEETNRAALDEHLASCPGCRAEMADLELTRKLLVKGLPEEEPARRIAFVMEAPKHPLRFWQWSFAGAAAMAVLFAVLAVRRPPEPGSTAAVFTRAEVEQIVTAAVKESEQRQRAQTADIIQAASTRMAEQMRYFESTQSIVYKQAEQNRSDLQQVAALVGQGGERR